MTLWNRLKLLKVICIGRLGRNGLGGCWSPSDVRVRPLSGRRARHHQHELVTEPLLLGDGSGLDRSGGRRLRLLASRCDASESGSAGGLERSGSGRADCQPPRTALDCGVVGAAGAVAERTAARTSGHGTVFGYCRPALRASQSARSAATMPGIRARWSGVSFA